MRCPFKFREFTEPAMQQCDEECALMFDNTDQTDSPSAICAIALLAKAANDLSWLYSFEQEAALPYDWMPRNEIKL